LGTFKVNSYKAASLEPFLFGLPLYWVAEWGWIGWLGAVVCWPLSYWLMNFAFDLYFFKRDK
jgi:hypothetical protein